MNRKPKKIWRDLSIRKKLLLAFALTSILMFVINLFMYWQVNRTIHKIDEIYVSNVSLNELSDAFDQVQNDTFSYLNVKSSSALENYYRSEQIYRDLVEQLNDENTDNPMKILEKNIRGMSESYLSVTDDAISAKRGRNVDKYKEAYEEAEQLHKYINSYIYDLNNLQFKNNSSSYQALLQSLRYLEVVSSLVLIAITGINVLILLIITRNITRPLTDLALTANQVGQGDFDVELPVTDSMDEVGVVTRAFNKMVASLKQYIARTKESMEKEQKMMERELLMETHLKDAQLKYLQAQINPHFLFNSLNAGAQLAMMEDAEKTCLFVERMADFFRYNVKKVSEDSTLNEEIEAVDNYIYILNVRFAGDIHFTRKVDPRVGEQRVPSMILQPLVENAVNHGIRNVEWQGEILLTVQKQDQNIQICIRDNGKGMTEDRIREILDGTTKDSVNKSDSTGIGMDNVINRLELYYNKKDILTIKSEGENKGTEVVITLPMS